MNLDIRNQTFYKYTFQFSQSNLILLTTSFALFSSNEVKKSGNLQIQKKFSKTFK